MISLLSKITIFLVKAEMDGAIISQEAVKCGGSVAPRASSSCLAFFRQETTSKLPWGIT